MLNASRYFRISVTARCNMSCRYCHREGITGECRREDELSPDDIAFACRVALDSGFRKFKLTGGEPTLRDDITEIVSALSKLNLPDLSMITNATRLEYTASALKEAGLNRLNISLNTLDPVKFSKTQSVSSSAAPSQILRGLEAAVKAGFRDIKINFVFSSHESVYDLQDMIKYFKDKPYVIVLLPVISVEEYYSLDYLYKIVSSYGILNEVIITDDEGIRKRLITLACGAKILLRADELANLRPFTFCDECAVKEFCREGIFPVRMTYDGVLAPCMASDTHRINVREHIRSRNYEGMKSAFAAISQYYRKD